MDEEKYKLKKVLEKLLDDENIYFPTKVVSHLKISKEAVIKSKISSKNSEEHTLFQRISTEKNVKNKFFKYQRELYAGSMMSPKITPVAPFNIPKSRLTC